MKSIYITVTAHNPLNRIDTTLKVLKGYESIELEKEIDIYIDYDHRLDLDEFSLIVASHTNFNRVGFVVAGEDFKETSTFPLTRLSHLLSRPLLIKLP